MVVCVIALVVFGILAVFSAKYRPLAKEAFNCVFRRLTLRKCETGFDKRMKAKITGKLMIKHPKFARFVYKRFEIISWIFTILLVVSIAYSAFGIYNLAVHGTCDPSNPKGCIFSTPLEPKCTPCETNCTCAEKNCSQATNWSACGGNCTCENETCKGLVK